MIEPTESEVVAEEHLRADTQPAVAPEGGGSPDLPIGRNRDFQAFLFGQGLSGFGDAITFTALPDPRAGAHRLGPGHGHRRASSRRSRTSSSACPPGPSPTVSIGAG